MKLFILNRMLFRNLYRTTKIVHNQAIHTTCTKLQEKFALRNLNTSIGFLKNNVYRYSRKTAIDHEISSNNSRFMQNCYCHLKYSTDSNDELSLSNEKVQHYLLELKNQFRACSESQKEDDQMTARSLKPIMSLLEEVDMIHSDIDDLQGMVNDPESDKEMRQIAQADLEDVQEKLREVEENVLNSLVPVEPLEDTDTLLEISAGVGGQEAMLFCQELFEMYMSYADFMGWEAEINDYETTDIGGLRHAVVVVRGEGAYRLLKYEGGIHRVQRVPKTEKSGRIHTSTVSVAVMPQPSEIDIQILEKDLKIETKRASGAGGQHVNTTDSAVRIIHIPTGIAVESQKERSQHRNKDECLKKLRVQLYQIQLDENMNKYTSNKKLQVGTKARSEKIRTYNFPQDRVTDHRIGVSVHNLPSVLSGTEDLHSLVCQLLEEAWRERLLDVINNPQVLP